MLTIPIQVFGDDKTTAASARAPQAFLVVVDEYEVSQSAESDASGERILEMIAEGHDDVSHVSRCAVTATVGVPTRATFEQQVARVSATTKNRAGTSSRSFQNVSVGTSLNVLLEHHDSAVELQLRYESSSIEESESDETPGPLVTADIESTLRMAPGDVRLCGLLKQGSTKVFTVRLSR